MGQEIIQIDNLKCGGCASSIRQALLAMEGVLEVKVDTDTDTVEVGFEKESHRDKYIRVLSKLGYPEAGTSTILQKGKSYISCAIGRMKKS